MLVPDYVFTKNAEKMEHVLDIKRCVWKSLWLTASSFVSSNLIILE